MSHLTAEIVTSSYFILHMSYLTAENVASSKCSPPHCSAHASGLASNWEHQGPMGPLGEGSVPKQRPALSSKVQRGDTCTMQYKV